MFRKKNISKKIKQAASSGLAKDIASKEMEIASAILEEAAKELKKKARKLKK